MLFCLFHHYRQSLPHRENIVCSNDLGLQDVIIDFERNLFGRNRIWAMPTLGHLRTYPTSRSFGQQWPLWQYICISLFPSKSFSTPIIPSSLKCPLQEGPDNYSWKQKLSNCTTFYFFLFFLNFSSPFKNIREERHGPLLPVAAKGLLAQGIEQLWCFTSSAPGEVQMHIALRAREP